MKRAFGCALALCFAAGCGAGGPPPAETPSMAPPAEKSLDDERDRDGAGDAAEDGEQFAQPPSSTKEETQAQSLSLDGALALFRQSESELATGIVDCGKACKALGSMERSMDRICELTGPDDPEKRCQSAREKAKAARERVQKHCPDCGSS